jgi:1,4-alpha-glucan branching enzyme
MKRLFFFMFIGFVTTWVSAQVVTTQPAIPTEDSEIVVTFDATAGTAGLEGYTGDVYAHTGVISSESTGDSDWKNVLEDWGVNVEKAKLTRVADNTYELTITPDIRTFYGVPEGEEILKMAFVFRSEAEVGGSWLEGKDEGGKDIIIDIYTSGLTALLANPVEGVLFNPGELIDVTGQGQDSESMELFLDGASIATASSGELTHSFNAPTDGSHQLVLVASAGTETDADTVNFYIKEPVVEEPRPAGLKNGANIIDDNTVTLLLQAPEKAYVYVLGDFNDWEPRPGAQMKKDGEWFWLTVNDAEPGKEYAYQYYIDGEVKIADPYTNKVLDPWNDKYIIEEIYPGLKPYPTDNGADGIVSVFSATPEEYQWQTSDFIPDATEDLVIYELLIRDFTSAQDIKTVTDTLDYLQRLGVNAIELMPFNEFEGNDSWGYNPSFYFATDKAYGTINDYKEFVDECHARGIAVIMDMVLNHSFGQSPLVRMYWEGDKPADNNPWYNRDHNMENTDAHWGYDFDHESEYTRQLIDSINSFWMSEFRIDGFRFDFTKGFTNTPYGPGSWASDYDADRIAILTRMTNEIWNRNSDAIVIFEHLSNNSEETVLADHGILLWGNMNHAFSEGVMGYNEAGNSDFSWASYQQRGWTSPNVVAYMESHDEERVMYRALNNGFSSNEYNVRELETAVVRSAMASTFLMSIPGPRMIWQFGELGYDVSIDDGGRLGQKPPRWDYLENYARESLWNFYAEMIHLRKNQPVFSTTDFELDVSGAVKRISLNGEDVDVRLIGNFGTESSGKAAFFSQSGWWYNHFQGDSINVTNENVVLPLRPGEFRLYTSKKLEGFRNVTSSGPEVFNQPHGVEIFPNPVKDAFFVKGKSGYQTEKIVLYDFSGRVVLQKKSWGKNSFDVSFLPGGMYILEVVDDQSNRSWHKMVKE